MLATPFNTDARDPTLHETIQDQIYTAATIITQCQDIGVSALKPSQQAIMEDKTPTTFLLYNLTAPQYQTILERKVWSSMEITFRVASPKPAIPEFLFTLLGLTTTVALVEQINCKIWKDETFHNFLGTIPQAMVINKGAPPTVNIQGFIDSVIVKHLETKGPKGIPKPTFNIYADRNCIQDRRIWVRIRDFFAEREYSSTLKRRAKMLEVPYNCGICHSADC